MKTWSIVVPDSLFKKGVESISAPYIPPVNKFLSEFVQSSQPRVEFSFEDIQPNLEASPLFSALKGLDFERVRLRLRAISNLNPVVNLETDEGIIRMECRLSGKWHKVKIRSIFLPKAKSIALEIIDVIPKALAEEKEQ